MTLEDRSYVYTLGDSTLDNLYWMLRHDPNVEQAKRDSVEGRLQQKVQDQGLRVISHAYDGFTTRSVLGSDTIGEVLPGGDAYDLYFKEKTASRSTRARPLDELMQEIQKSPPNKAHYVVISVGGNDFRVNLLNPRRLLADIPQIQQRYIEIVEKLLKNKNIRPIIMLQYRTDANNERPYFIYTILKVIGLFAVVTHLTSLALLTAPIWVLAGKISLVAGGLLAVTGAVTLHFGKKIAPLSLTKDVLLGKKIGMTMLGIIMKSFYQPILEKARSAGIPVLDLPNTFNPYHNLYDCSIEPNKEGGELIAEGIHHIIKNHDFNRASILYSKPGQQYQREPNNPPTWQVNPV